MTSVQWEQVKERFHDALERPAGTRQSFLIEACPDDIVRAEVERLLMEHGRAGFFLSHAAGIRSTDVSDDFHSTERFDCLDWIGAGTFGVVYRVFDRVRNSVIALKKLRNCDSSHLLRFKREFRSLVDLAHPNLVQLYELFGEDRHWFFTMELIHGVDFLSHVRADNISGSWERLRPALYQLATGVQALHSGRRLHRDLKPSNVLVEAGGRVVILDFGLVREFESESIEQSLALAGSPAYMAPEQAAGRSVDEAADWYAVGVILYQALTGHLPFSGSWFEVLERKQNENATRCRVLVGEAPADLDEACRHLLERDPGLRAKGRDILLAQSTGNTKSAVRPDSFVGRGVELRLLRERFDASCSGKGQTVLLQGQSGIGKTSFVAHFLGGLKHDRPNAVILRGRCRESESMPYKALDPIIDELVKHLQRLPEALGMALLPRHPELLRRLFPVFEELSLLFAFSDESLSNLGEQQIRRRAFEALCELLSRMTDRSPVVISIDDLQWADLDSIAFLADLVIPANAPAVMLILSFRSEKAHDNPALRVLRDLQRRLIDAGSCLDIELRGLPENDGRVLLELLQTEGRRITEEQSCEILQQAVGSPLILSELLRFAVREPDSDETRPVAGVLMSDMICHRAKSLSSTARQLLEVLSVAGEPISKSLLYRAVNMADEDPARETGLLIRDHLARFSGGAQEVELEPFHDQVREAVLAWISPADLRAWHSHLAKLLQTEADTNPHRLLRHYRESGNLSAAFETALAAAKTAETALAFEQAARFLAEALETGEAGEGARANLLRKRAESLANAGHGYESGQCYLEAARWPAHNDALEMRRLAAEQLIRSGHLEEGVRLFTELLSSAGVHMPVRRLETLLRMLALRAFIRLRGLHWRERTEAEILPGALRKLDLLWSGAMALVTIDPISGSYLQALHMLASLRGGERSRLVLSISFGAVYECLGGTREYEHGRKLISLAQQWAERLDDPYPTAIAHGCWATVDFLSGRLKDGLSHCRMAIAGFTQPGPRARAWELGTCNALLIWFLGWSGSIRELSEVFPLMAEEGRSRGDVYTEVSLRCCGTSHLMELAADNPEQALAEIATSMKQWRKTTYDLSHFYATFAVVECLLYAGRTKEARQILLSDWRAIRQSLYTRKSQVHRTMLFYLRGRTALAEWRRSSTSHDLRAEIEQFARRLSKLGSPWGEAFSILLLAGVKVRIDRGAEAIYLLESAERILRDQNLRLVAAAALRRRGELRGNLGSPLVEAADAFMRSENIRQPDRITTMFLPGY